MTEITGHFYNCGGEGEIRTLGAIADTTVFKTVPLNHSGTSPWVVWAILTDEKRSVERLTCQDTNED